MSVGTKERLAATEKSSDKSNGLVSADRSEIFTRIFETNRDAIFVTDKSGYVRFVNRKAELYFNASSDKIIGRKMLIPHRNGETREIHISRPDKDMGIGEFISFEVKLSNKEVFYVSTLRDVTDLVKLREELRGLTLVDSLIDLCNRQGFFILAQQQLKLATRSKKGFYLFMVCMDNYKKESDEASVKFNNQLVVDFSKILRDTFRKSDIIARMSEDTFALLAVEAEVNSSDSMAKRLLARVEGHNDTIRVESNKIQASMGIAYYSPERPCSFDDLVAEADMLLYKNKTDRKKSALSWYLDQNSPAQLNQIVE